jgi:hypothetical protein
MAQSNYITTIPGKGLVTFLFDSQIISCQNTINTLTAQELLNALREAEDSTVGLGYTKIADATGKDPLSLTVAVGITLTLLENWTVYSQKSSGIFTLENGNIIRHDATTPFYPNTNVVYQSMLIQGGVIAVISSGSGLSPEESAKLLGLPSASDNASQVWSSSTATSWGLNTFGEWVKGLLSKNFFVGYS